MYRIPLTKSTFILFILAPWALILLGVLIILSSFGRYKRGYDILSKFIETDILNERKKKTKSHYLFWYKIYGLIFCGVGLYLLFIILSNFNELTKIFN